MEFKIVLPDDLIIVAGDIVDEVLIVLEGKT